MPTDLLPDALRALLVANLTDPFRIGLIVALVYTTVRNAGATGTALPLAAGVLFVAVILPATMGQIGGAAGALPLWQTVGVGVVANAIILAPVWLGWTLWRRRQG